MISIPLEFALGDNLVDHAVIDLDEAIAVEGRAESLFEQREDPRDGGVNLVAVDLHQGQPLGLPLDDGVEQIEDDRLEVSLSHWGSMPWPWSAARRD